MKQPMRPRIPVDLAERASRKRAVGGALAALVFLALQLVANPFFAAEGGQASRVQVDMWAVNAIVLLLLLASGGGLIYSRKVRDLLNDEVSMRNYRTAVATGFWVAMVAAMAFYFVASLERFTAQQAVYAIVTPSVLAALLTFAYREHQAIRRTPRPQPQEPGAP